MKHALVGWLVGHLFGNCMNESSNFD